jgi:hypothetical protein
MIDAFNLRWRFPGRLPIDWHLGDPMDRNEHLIAGRELLELARSRAFTLCSRVSPCFARILMKNCILSSMTYLGSLAPTVSCGFKFFCSRCSRGMLAGPPVGLGLDATQARGVIVNTA